LDKQIAFVWIQSTRKVIKSNLYDVLAHLLRVLNVVGKSLRIGLEDKNLIVKTRVLQLHTTAKRTDVVAYVQLARRTVAGKNDFLFWFHI
jgi:hypothetical protein